jgi:hypothetical protein
MDNDLELEDYKMNCLRDQQHQIKINKLCESHNKKHIDYMKECVIAQKLIHSNYQINNDDVHFID